MKSNKKQREGGSRLAASTKGSKKPKSQSVSNNVALGKSIVSTVGVPVMRGSADGCVISHRELVDTLVLSSGVANLTSYPINPGLTSPFPWLGTIANSYETYRFRKLKFEYVPYVSALTAGSIAFAVDYDAIDVAPVSKQEMMSYAGSVTSQIWSAVEMTCPKERMDKLPQRWTRSGLITPSTGDIDLKTYDVGTLFVMTQAPVTAETTIGDLYVSYEIELKTPQTPKVGEGTITTGASSDPANVFGIQGASKGNLPLSVPGNSGDVLFATPWVGKMTLFLRGTSGAGLPTVPNMTVIPPATAHPGDNLATVLGWTKGYDLLGFPSVLMDIACSILDPSTRINFSSIAQNVSLGVLRFASGKNYANLI